MAPRPPLSSANCASSTARCTPSRPTTGVTTTPPCSLTGSQSKAPSEARQGKNLAGYCFGVTLQPTTPWWQHLLTPLPEEVTTERPGRTLAVVEFLVRASWRRRHIGQALHDMLLRGRPEERATLTVLPAAAAAQRAYVTWGWRHVAQKRNPLPGSPIFDVLIKELNG
jgi:hypothetical protein